MILELENTESEVAKTIKEVFQLSYAVEAELLGAKDFPPLKRSLEGYTNSTNQFFGFYIQDEIAGITEIKKDPSQIHIQSLVVHPDFFRRGVGQGLMNFVLSHFESSRFMVETGVDNLPAIALYEKVGFREVKRWDTSYGIRKIRLMFDV